MTNVAADEGYTDVRKRLEIRFLAVLEETGDPRVTGDGATYDLSPFAGEE